MSNRPLWNIRQRHEWLATPLKAKRSKKCQRVRIGLEAAMQRKAPHPAEQPAQVQPAQPPKA
jgi:hypothetical protein